MGDFANSNLCGASPEMNDLFKKLDEAAADIESKIDAAASEAAGAFASAQNELNTLTAKLQSIEIPQLPKLNLQAEIKALSELIPGTPEYLSSLATITKEFGADLEAAGKDLGTLISDGLSAITSGGNICNVVPNIEKEAGSTNPATEKATNVLQAAVAPETETVSTVTRNATVSETVTENKAKVESYAVTNEPPTEDKGAIKVVKAEKTIKTPTGGEAKVVQPGSGKNFTPDGGMTNRKSKRTEKFSLSQIETGLPRFIGPASWTASKVQLKHEPYGKIQILLHFEDMDKYLTVPEPGSTNEKVIGTSYNSYYGLHMYAWILTGSGLETQGNLFVKTDGKELTFMTPKLLADHSGKIESVTNEVLNVPGTFRCYGSHFSSWQKDTTFNKFREDKSLNKVFGGFAAIIAYEYNENYDPGPST
jgi:hypothetical protein